MPDTDAFCSANSLTLNEPLFGTAQTNEVWFLLEYTQPWGAKVFPESTLSAPIKKRISGYLETIPSSNILFIKQPGRQRDGIAFFVVVARESHPQLHKFRLESYDDLLTLDIPAIIAGDSAYADYLSDVPLYLICTNAKRDACCAKFGLPVYTNLTQYAGTRAWQSSHIGGHRFAPTGIFFPHGICYGRIEPQTVHQLAEQYHAGKIDLTHLRGRTCYDKPVQAAEYWLRKTANIHDINALKYTGVQTAPDGSLIVEFTLTNTQETRRIHIREIMTGVEVAKGCHTDEKAPVIAYRLAES